MRITAARVGISGRRGTTRRRTVERSLKPAHAGLLHLQRTAGNAAVVAALESGVAAVQRHFVKGPVHGAHAPPVVAKGHTPSKAQITAANSHTKEQAEQAVAWAEELQVEAAGIAERAASAATAQAATTELPRLAEITLLVQAQFHYVDTCADKAQGQLKQRLVRARDLVGGSRGKASGAEETKARSELEAAIALVAPSKLAQAEREAVLAAKATGRALAATAKAKAAGEAATARSASERSLAAKGRLDALAGEVARFPFLVTRATLYRDAAAAASSMSARMVSVADDRVAVLERINEQRAGRNAYLRAQREVTAAEETVRQAQDILDQLLLYRAHFLVDLARLAPGRLSVAQRELQKNEVADDTDQARQQLLDAQAYLAQAKDVLAGTEVVEASDVDAAVGAAAAAALAAAQGPTGPTSEAAELELLGKARSLAGGPAELAELTASMPDKAELVALLNDVGAGAARRWFAAGDIGVAKVRAAVTALAGSGLGPLLGEVGAGIDNLLANLAAARLAELADPAQLGGPALKALVTEFSAIELDALATELGPPVLKALLADLPAHRLKQLGLPPSALKAALAEVDGAAVSALVGDLGGPRAKEYFTDLTPAQVKDLLPHLPAATLKKLDLTGASLKDLLTAFTAAEVAQLATDLGDPALKDLLGEFSAVDLKAFRVEVTPVRLVELITVKKLKAKALKHYGATWLRTFVGAGATTMQHLVTAHFNGAGKVSGAHDEQVFLNFIGQVHAGGTQPYGAVLGHPTAAATYMVNYETYDVNGLSVNGGTKTLTQGLAGAQPAWQDKYNQAVWYAIRDRTFPTAGGDFTGKDDAGKLYAGHHNGGTQVKTIFPL